LQEIDTKDDTSKISIYCPIEAIDYVRDYIIQFHKTNSVLNYDKFDMKMEDFYKFVPVSQIRSTERFIRNGYTIVVETQCTVYSCPF
jgi:hypothetical protein